MRTDQEILQDWLEGGKSERAKKKYIARTKNPRRNPMEAATTPEASAKYLANTRKAEESGYRAARTRAVSLQTYTQMCELKGAARLGPGMEAAKAKYAAQLPKLKQAWDAAHQAALAVTGTGEDAAMERVRAARRVMMTSFGKDPS